MVLFCEALGRDFFTCAYLELLKVLYIHWRFMGAASRQDCGNDSNCGRIMSMFSSTKYDRTRCPKPSDVLDDLLMLSEDETTRNLFLLGLVSAGMCCGCRLWPLLGSDPSQPETATDAVFSRRGEGPRTSKMRSRSVSISIRACADHAFLLRVDSLSIQVRGTLVVRCLPRIVVLNPLIVSIMWRSSSIVGTVVSFSRAHCPTVSSQELLLSC